MAYICWSYGLNANQLNQWTMAASLNAVMQTVANCREIFRTWVSRCPKESHSDPSWRREQKDGGSARLCTHRNMSTQQQPLDRDKSLSEAGISLILQTRGFFCRTSVVCCRMRHNICRLISSSRSVYLPHFLLPVRVVLAELCEWFFLHNSHPELAFLCEFWKFHIRLLLHYRRQAVKQPQ